MTSLSRKSTQEFERLQINYSGVMRSLYNSKGWTKETLSSLEEKLTEAHYNLLKLREKGLLDFSKLLVEMRNEAEKILNYASTLHGQIDNFVVLGIGGSALGPLAIQQALNPYYYNELAVEERQNRPRLYVIDNIDPSRFIHLLDMLDLKRTVFNVITKSGNTSETMAQFLIVREKVRQICGENYPKHIVVTTDKDSGNLLPIALKEGYPCFYIPKGIGGRFSELTPVGLLPAAICGIDILNLLDGAIVMDQWIRRGMGIKDNPAYLMAAISYLAWQEGKNISVFMPYSDGLKTFSDWYAQLWAESLGKRSDRNGQDVWIGQTPVKALGVTDQHSQVQLYTEGPDDKIITFLTVERLASDITIPHDDTIPEEIQFLCGHTLGQLLSAEQKATEFALTLKGRKHRRIILPELDAYYIGQLILLLEWETAFMGELFNINAFDQPGVEEGKRATFALMGRKGFEDIKTEIERLSENEYIF